MLRCGVSEGHCWQCVWSPVIAGLLSWAPLGRSSAVREQKKKTKKKKRCQPNSMCRDTMVKCTCVPKAYVKIAYSMHRTQILIAWHRFVWRSATQLSTEAVPKNIARSEGGKMSHWCFKACSIESVEAHVLFRRGFRKERCLHEGLVLTTLMSCILLCCCNVKFPASCFAGYLIFLVL